VPGLPIGAAGTTTATYTGPTSNQAEKAAQTFVGAARP
jgi:hypothetical protein